MLFVGATRTAYTFTALPNAVFSQHPLARRSAASFGCRFDRE